jgi:predicted nuclease of predicted toxin-antitoxin system
MKLWIDAQVSPSIALWINNNFSSCEAVAVRDLGLREAEDEEIFAAAKGESVTVITKDSDFVFLLDQHGPPPKVIWLTCGNTSNAMLKETLASQLQLAVELLTRGEDLVEINSP